MKIRNNPIAIKKVDILFHTTIAYPVSSNDYEKLRFSGFTYIPSIKIHRLIQKEIEKSIKQQLKNENKKSNSISNR